MAIDKLVLWLQQNFGYFHGKGWILEVFAVVFITMLLTLLEGMVYKRLLPRLQKTKRIWDEAVCTALHKPLNVLIWLVGIMASAEVVRVSTEQPAAVFEAVNTVRNLGIIALFAWFLLRLISQAEEHCLEGRMGSKRLDKTTINALGKITKASVMITAALVALQTLGIGISGVLAFGGIGGAAVAFSAKDLLANFFGGLIIYLDRPFAVGDWIRSPDRNIEGTVEHIGWRLCRIRTFDKRPLYVPNSLFTMISIENPSRMTNRRIKTNIGLRYDDASKVGDILPAVEAMLRNHPDIDTSQTLMVNLVEFGASSLNFMIYTFTKTTNWERYQAVQQDVFLKTIDIIEAHGAQCAFPTTTLHVPEGLQVKGTGKQPAHGVAWPGEVSATTASSPSN
ncbi:MAG: mechanosensitive ion channel protein MscS [Legionellales bacterium]|nr:mechanosensitive ion channel protein MscS [Legionellales bacterium]|tara:strand:- start:1408 stop:2589 length:1182 start_codon:yes stop_codon:yes gene_type:complete